MCVACRESQDKNTLVRVVRTNDGIFIDKSGKLAGRGAYLHAEPSCWDRGIKKALEKSLKVDFSDADRKRLNDYQKNDLTSDDQVGLNPA
jgi:predicted RNA-binding protein YlxR (DUF448 family)